MRFPGSASEGGYTLGAGRIDEGKAVAESKRIVDSPVFVVLVQVKEPLGERGLIDGEPVRVDGDEGGSRSLGDLLDAFKRGIGIESGELGQDRVSGFGPRAVFRERLVEKNSCLFLLAEI